MLDIKFIRENTEIIKFAAKKKHIEFNVDDLLKIDKERIDISRKIEELKAKQNLFSQKIIEASAEEKQNLIDEVSILKEEIKKLEPTLNNIMTEWQSLMLKVPNIPDISVPDGESDLDNKEIKSFGEKRVFNFEPKDHIEIMQKLKMVDFERGTKVHGFRGYFLTNEGVRLTFAIWNYALDFFSKKGFNPVITPTIVRKENLYGTGHLPGEVDDFYKTQDEDILIGTAEVSLMGFHRNEVLAINELPKKYLGFSPCFRREAGSYSKDTKGLIRVHEFYKFEQVILCEASHDESVKFHEELNRNTEEFIETLNIPYRTVINCGGDLGQGQVKKYDIELWIPKEQKYREISSASYFHDFQSRRSNIKYKDNEGKTRYVHSLNSTAIPTPRILVSLVENYQEETGEIVIPEVLRKYMGGQEKIRFQN